MNAVEVKEIKRFRKGELEMKTKVLVVIYFILPTNFSLLLPPFFKKQKLFFLIFNVYLLCVHVS